MRRTAASRKRTEPPPKRRSKLRVVDDTPYPYTSCRGPIKHRWGLVGPLPGRRRRTSFGTEVTLRCDNCPTIKILICSRITGELIASPQYIYPDDYKTERHDAGYWRAQWMDETATNLLVDLEEDD